MTVVSLFNRKHILFTAPVLALSGLPGLASADGLNLDDFIDYFDQADSYLAWQTGSHAEFKIDTSNPVDSYDPLETTTPINRSTLGIVREKNWIEGSATGAAGPAAGSEARSLSNDTPTSTFGGNVYLAQGWEQELTVSDTDVYGLPTLRGLGGITCYYQESDCSAPAEPGDLRYVGGDGDGVNDDRDYTTQTNLVRPAYEGIQAAFNEAFSPSYADFTGELDLTDTNYDYNLGNHGNANEGFISNWSGTTNGDFILSERLTSGALVSGGLNVINIKTGGGKFKIKNSNFIVDGDNGSRFMFFLNGGSGGGGIPMQVQNSRILAGNDMGLNNILFAVKTTSVSNSFNLTRSEINGAAFWDLSRALGEVSDNPDWNGDAYTASVPFYPDSGDLGTISVSKTRGCAQFVGTQMDFTDVSLDRCAFSKMEYNTGGVSVPVPAPPALMMVGLVTLALRRRSSRLQTVRTSG